MLETTVMHRCMLALSEAGCAVFRGNVGLFFTRDGRPVQTGLPRGFSDLFGVRPDGRAFFVECKSERGRTTSEQEAFLAAMSARGAVAVVARDPDRVVEQVMGFSEQ